MIASRIEKAKLLSAITIENPRDAVPLCRALHAGGLDVGEITFRTPATRDALRMVATELPDFACGAGTVTALDELEAARNAGARFIVTPGLNPRIVRRSQELDLPIFPGVATPSDIECALDLGLTHLKLFPVAQLGGPSTIKALSGPYGHRGVRFIATGGVDGDNVTEYLAMPTVAAVCGSWIASRDLIQTGQWDAITQRARAALGKIETFLRK